MMGQAVIGKVTFDSVGNIIGIAIAATAHAEATSDMRVTVEVGKHQPPQYDRQHEQPAPETQGGGRAE
jgi:hypothetical protein